MTSRGGTEVTWFATNLPKRIRLTPGSAANSSEFQYTADGQRWRHKYNSGGTVYTQVSIGALLDKVTQGSTTDFRHAIHANGQVVALYSRKSTGTNTTRYLLRDHLGSIDIVSSSSGSLVLRESFDAYGARRGANWSGVPTSSELSTMRDATRRGFTDHEHLDSTGLIHMNGRVYDPQLGRFLSADPFVQAPHTTQGRNRYSYVADNPLRYIDPSGFVHTNLHVAFVDWGRSSVSASGGTANAGLGGQLSPGESALARGVMAGVFGAVAPPIGILFAATWNPNAQGGPAASPSWLNMAGPAGLSGGREAGGGGGTSSPRPEQQTERRTVADGTLARDFPAVASSASAAHVFLDVVSATGVPLASEAAGVASGIWYLIERDLVGAGLSLAGLVPAFGTVADTARVSKAADAAALLPNARGVVRRLTQQTDQVFYRVFSGDRSVGSFLTAVPPRSRDWAQEALALPPHNKAEMIQEVLVPAGTNLLRSRTAPIAEWGRLRGGAEQFELLDRIPTSNFGPGVPLP
jgi:RHS repeat-associated protein